MWAPTRPGGRKTTMARSSSTARNLQASLSLLYTRPVADGLNLEMTLNGRYQSESNTIFEDIDLYKIPAYGVANVSVGLRSAEDRWSFTSVVSQRAR